MCATPAASKQQAEFGAAKTLLTTTCKAAQERAYIADQEIKMLREKLKTNDLEVHRLIQRIENLVPEAASSRAVMFEAALDEACARLPPTPLILLLNNIRRAVLSLSFFYQCLPHSSLPHSLWPAKLMRQGCHVAHECIMPHI